MSEWSNISFGKNVKLNESTFDTKVGGGKFLDIGIHKDMVISEVEPRVSQAGNPYLMVKYENDDGAGIKGRVMINGKPDDEGNDRFHWEYTGLASAVAAADRSVSLKFFGESIPSNPELMAALVGLKVTIKIAHGKEGYLVKDSPMGGKLLIDIETGEPFDGTEEYAGFTEAKEAAAELQLKRCWNEVVAVTAPSDEAKEANIEVIKGLMEPKKKKAKAKPVSL